MLDPSPKAHQFVAGLPRRVCPPNVQVSHAHWDLGLSGEIVHVATCRSELRLHIYESSLSLQDGLKSSEAEVLLSVPVSTGERPSNVPCILYTYGITKE